MSYIVFGVAILILWGLVTSYNDRPKPFDELSQGERVSYDKHSLRPPQGFFRVVTIVLGREYIAIEDFSDREKALQSARDANDPWMGISADDPKRGEKEAHRSLLKAMRTYVVDVLDSEGDLLLGREAYILS